MFLLSFYHVFMYENKLHDKQAANKKKSGITQVEFVVLDCGLCKKEAERTAERCGIVWLA